MQRATAMKSLIVDAYNPEVYTGDHEKGRVGQLSRRLVLHLVLSPVVAFLLGAGFGRVTAPDPPAPSPSNEQLTIAAATLVHGLEVQNDYALASSPDFAGCRKTKAGGVACDFLVTYVDESSATWELTLDDHNVPTLIKRIRAGRVPPPG